jgi:hypothetical protein
MSPETGDLIPGSGGCRKIRWTRPGMGKRGGVKVIYALRPKPGTVLLLTIYSKSARDSISADVLKGLLELTQ